MSITKIAEELVKREYQKKGVNLPIKFWNIPEYRPKYQMQMRYAAKLVRTFGEEAVWNALGKESWCYSLGGPKIQAAIELEASKLAQKETLRAIQQSRPEEDDDTALPAFRAVVENNKPLEK